MTIESGFAAVGPRRTFEGAVEQIADRIRLGELSQSTRTASRSVGRLICIAAASSRSEGRRSPSASSPTRMRSAICSTAPSNVRRGPTGANPLSMVTGP